MARWKLVAPHYLVTTSPSQWEHVEQRGGKQIRLRFDVPTLLDPADPSSWTRRWGGRDDGDGEIIVCLGSGESSDIVLPSEASITPDMTPIDDEAKAISAKYETHWSYKPDTAENTFSQSLVDNLQAQFEVARATPAKVEVEGLSEILASLAAGQKLLAETLSANHRRA